MTPLESVEAFIAAWSRNDMDGAYGMMADDIIWDNIPMGPVTGVEGAKALMAGFPPIDDVKFIVHAISAIGNKVLTERTDRFTFTGGKIVDIRLMGIFEVNPDGKIGQWRDYFDLGMFQADMAK